jgi:exodeoxyribonuclease-5
MTTEDGQQVAGRPRFYTGHYDDHLAFDPERPRRDWLEMKGLVETSWGYAITCHKAQGSQFPTAVVLDEGFGSSPVDRNRWLYTAITRAEWGLVILS